MKSANSGYFILDNCREKQLRQWSNNSEGDYDNTSNRQTPAQDGQIAPLSLITVGISYKQINPMMMLS